MHFNTHGHVKQLMCDSAVKSVTELQITKGAMLQIFLQKAENFLPLKKKI